MEGGATAFQLLLIDEFRTRPLTVVAPAAAVTPVVLAMLAVPPKT